MGKIDFDKTNEAFKAGNRARKKESVQDTVDSVYSIQEQIDQFKELTGYKLELRDGKPCYDGNLDLEGYELAVLPQELTVKGWMSLSCNTKLTALPQDLIVEDSLNLAGCTGLTHLPADLHVGGFLTLTGCSGLTSLPDGLTVGKDIELGDCTGLTSLPDGLTVNGYLNLRGCTGLTSLPHGLTVENLDIRDTGITSIPSDLTVKKYHIRISKNLVPFFTEKLGIEPISTGYFKNIDIKASVWMNRRHLLDKTNEAFKAGNRARKKEAVQDNTDAVSRWRIPKKLETIDDWEAAFLLNTESVGITAAPRQSDSPSSTTRIYNLYVRSWENNSVTFSICITNSDFYSSDSPFGIVMRVILRLDAAIGNVSMHMVPVTDAMRNTSGRKIFTDLSAAMDSVWEIINYLRNSRYLGQVLKNPLILEFDSSDVIMLVIDEYLRSEPGCPLIWSQRDEYYDFLKDYEKELKRATAIGPWINWHGDTEVLAEAFKAGNRARKRESISGTSNIVSTRIPSITELGDMLLDLGFLVRSDKRDYADVRQEKAPDEIDSILFSKWYTPSGKVPETGPIEESMIMIRGGYGILHNKETGHKIPYISVEIHVDIMLDKETTGKYKLSSLSNSWSSILNLMTFSKVDEEFMPMFAVLIKLWSESDRVLKGLYDMVKDNILLMRVEQYIQKAYIHRLLCRLMPEFESWTYSEGFGSGKEIDPDSWQWQASGWIKVPEMPQVPVNEAFRAGNRARKKETVQDTVSDNVDPLIKFEDPNVEKICHEHGVYTIGDAARVETIQEWFEIDGCAGIDNPEIVKFNELRYFTGLTTIPVNAFLEQEKLEEIMIPDNVTVIGQCAFDSCKNLGKLVLPDRNSLELGNDCFQSTPALDTIVVPSGWTKWECIQNMKEAYDNELVWYQRKIDSNHIDEDHYFELLDGRLITTFENRQGTLDCRFDDLLQWWTGDDEYVPDDEDEMDEAFKAGNRARKKESIQDNAESYGTLDTRDKCAEMLKAMLTSPECPAVRIIGDRPAAVGDAPAIDPAEIEISEYLGNNRDYTLVVLKWEGVNHADSAQNLMYITQISFSEATDGSDLLISGGCFAGSDLVDFLPFPDISIMADVENNGRPKLCKLCYIDGWETVDPDGMTYSKVSVNAIAAVAAAVRQLRERDRRKDPSSLGRYPVNEAFKAGNRARKKEPVQDNAEEVDSFAGLSEKDCAELLRRLLINPAMPPVKKDGGNLDLDYADPVDKVNIRVSTHFSPSSYGGEYSLVKVNWTGVDPLDPAQNIDWECEVTFTKDMDLENMLVTGGCWGRGDLSDWTELPEMSFGFNRPSLKDCDEWHVVDPDGMVYSEVNFNVVNAVAAVIRTMISNDKRKDPSTLGRYPVGEAFKAGNRARKKEAAADTVQDTDKFIGDNMPADKIIPDLFLGAVSTTQALLRIQGIINPPFKPEFPNYMKWFIDIISSMYIRTSIPWHRKISIMNVKGSPGRNKGQEFDIILEMGIRKYHFLITPGSEENQYAVWLKMTVHLFDIDFNPDYPEQSDIRIAPAMKYFIAGFLETYRMFFEEKGVLEAFKAGNRARKKESAQDAANIVKGRSISVDDFVKILSVLGIKEKFINILEHDIIEKYNLPFKVVIGGNSAYFTYVIIRNDGQNEQVCMLYWYCNSLYLEKLDGTKYTLLQGSTDGYYIHTNSLKVLRNILFDLDDDIDEAFRAGNQARKRESAQDAVNVVDTPVRFQDPVVRRYMEEHEITTMSKAANTILSSWDTDEHEDWFKPEKFNEFKLFTSTTHIEDLMFNGQEYLEEIELPPTVQSIGYGAFRFCQNLESIDIPNSCKEIGEDCFAGCDSIEWIHFPDSWTYEYAFEQFAKAFDDDITYLPNILADNNVGSWDEMPFPDTTITNKYYTFHLSDLFKKFSDQDALEMHGLLDEAFRAGNRARKKESAADAVEGLSKQKPFTGKEISDAFRAIIDSEDNPIRKNALPGYEDKIKPAVVLTQAARYSCEAFRRLFSRVMEGPWGKLKITWEEWRDGRRWGGWMELGVVKVLISRDDFKDGTPVKVWRFPLRIDGDFEDDMSDRFGIFAAFDAVENLNTEMHRPVITVYIRHNPYKIYAQQSFINGLNRFFSYEIWEAFRAGNRARKKETVQDTVESIDNVQAQIDLFKEQTGKELEIRDGHPYFNGTLYLKGCTGLTSLPAGLEVYQDLWIENCNSIHGLPADIKVGTMNDKWIGKITLKNCPCLTKIPEGLNVPYHLEITNCPVREIPDNVTVGYCLCLDDCPELCRIGRNLTVKGQGMSISNCPKLRELPLDIKRIPDLNDNGNDCAYFTHDHSLDRFMTDLGFNVSYPSWSPDKNYVKVSDWIEMQKHMVGEAFRAGNRARKKESVQDVVQETDSVQAQIDLFKDQTGIELEIRDGHPYFEGDLSLNGCTGLTRLPANLEVDRHLSLEDCTGLTSLPAGLKVGKSLWLKGCTGLTSLPVDLKVKGMLDLGGCTGLTSLPEGLEVDRDLHLNGCTGLTSLPDGLKVGGYLDLRNCTKLTSLPDGLKVGETLNLNDCTRLTSLPAGLKVGRYLDLTNCTGLTSLPAGLKVGGDLTLNGCTGLTSLPFDTVVQGNWIYHNGILTPFFRKLGIRVDRAGDTDAEDWFKWRKAHGYLTEAFKAGNRARKKEAAVDTVESVDVKITKEEVAGWFRNVIDSDRNTIPKDDPHAWPAMCLVNDALFTRLAINELADRIKKSDSDVIIDRISHGQFRNPKGPNQFGSKTLGFVDVTAVLKGRSFSWHWQFIIAIEDYNKGKEDYCYKLYVNSGVNSESLLPGPKNEPLVTVYARRTPYEIEVNEKFVDGINRILE